MICEDDVRFSSKWRQGVEKLVEFASSGVPWNHVSLQNSGGECNLQKAQDVGTLPAGILRGAFYFTRCYAITREAMERAVQTGVTPAHIDVGLAIANWGQGFILRPALVLDVPSRSDNDWNEGGLGPWLAGQMQSFTHFPCVVADRWKLNIPPLIMSREKCEEVGWKKFMDEPGSQHHINDLAPSLPSASAKNSTVGCCS